MRSRPVLGPNKGMTFEECFRTIWSEVNMSINMRYNYPNPYYTLFASRLHPYFPPYFVWFWNLSQLSWWIAPLMRFSVETAGACATFRCYIAMSTDVGPPPAGCCAAVEGGNRSRWSMWKTAHWAKVVWTFFGYVQVPLWIWTEIQSEN